MAFQLTMFSAFGDRSEGSTRRHALQQAVFAINAANTDTALDISNPVGTFWTQATADPIYGQLAVQALAKLQQIAGIAADMNKLAGEFLYNYVKVASAPTGNQYTLVITSHLPAIAFVSGSAPTAMMLTLGWNLRNGLEAIVDDRG